MKNIKYTIHLLLTTVILVSSFITNAQKSTLPKANDSWPVGIIGTDYNMLDENGEKDGAWIRVWPNGGLYYTGYFSHGEPTSNFLYFYESGALMSSIKHPTDDNELISAIHYRENGSVQASGFYSPTENNATPIRQGKWALYDDGSQQRKSETYNLGVLDGPYWIRNRGGELVEEGGYNEDGKDGVWTTYYDNGILRQSISYSSGELDGAFNTYFSNGALKIEGHYIDGKENGAWKTYSRESELELIIKYEYGTRVKEIRVNGTFEETFPDGRSSSEYTYRDKKRDGPFRVWYDQGEYVIEDFTDPETGEQMKRQVLVGTQVSKEGEFVEGELDGPLYHYSESGKLVKTEIYVAGVLTETE